MMGLANDIDCLSHVDLFQHMSREVLGVLALIAQTHIVRTGHIVCRVGEPAKGGYMVMNGTLAFQFCTPQSKHDAYLPPGSFFGEVALLTPVVWDATLYAHTPSTLMFIPRKDFLRLLKAHPEAASPIREILIGRLENLMAACEDILAPNSK